MTGGVVSLEEASNGFADLIGEVLADVLPDFPGIDVTLVEGTERAVLKPSNSDEVGRWRPSAMPDGPMLGISYVLRLDERGYLTVERSKFGLWLTVKGGKKTRPIVRQEYDRSNTVVPRAHVHFHGESTEMGWLLARNGAECTDEHAFHFPVGGVRFRPTIEDFLRFLEHEQLWTQWNTKPSRSQIVEAGLKQFERTQARATAARHQHEVAEALREAGWSVEPPKSVAD